MRWFTPAAAAVALVLLVGPASGQCPSEHDRAIQARIEAAQKAWGKITPARVPELIRALQGKEIATRIAAARALERLGPGAAPAVPALMAAARENTMVVSSTMALAAIGRASVPALTKAMHHKDPILRRWFARALAKIGPAAAPAAAALLRASRDPDSEVRANATEALGTIGLQNTRIAAALLVSVQDRNELVRVTASAALARLGPGHRWAAIRELVLRSGNWRAMQRLLASAGKAGVPPLTEALGHHEAAVRARAARALEGLGAGASEAIPALVQALGDSTDAVRVAAARALSRMGPRAAPAIPALARMLKSKGDAKVVALNALSKLGPRAVPVLLKEAKRDPGGDAHQALRNLGPAAGPALITLFRLASEETRPWPEEKQPCGQEEDRLGLSLACPAGTTRVRLELCRGVAVWCKTRRGVKHGPSLSTTRLQVDDHCIHSRGSYHHGKRHGPWRILRKKPQTYGSVVYRRGKRVGKAGADRGRGEPGDDDLPLCEDPDPEYPLPKPPGPCRRGRKHGRWVTGDKDAPDLIAQYRHGIRHGLYTRWGTGGPEDSSVRYKSLVRGYRKGVLHGRCFVLSGATLEARLEGQLRRGKRHGRWSCRRRECDEQAACWSGTYRRGLRHGTWTGWYKNKKGKRITRATGAYRRGLPHGRWTYRDTRGRTYLEGAFSNGKLTGNWTFIADGGQRTVVKFPGGRLQRGTFNSATLPATSWDLDPTCSDEPPVAEE